MSYYSELDSHIGNKIKVELDLPNYSAKEELGHATDIDTFDVTAKKRFYSFES